MNVAICGYPPLVAQIQKLVRRDGIEIKFFIEDFVSDANTGKENFDVDLPLINFFDFRRLVDFGELDGVIVLEEFFSNFTKNVVKICKLYGIPKIGVISRDLAAPVYWHDVSKIFMPRLEADITDKCNLKCAACYHFANFSLTEDFYPIEDFHSDVRRLSEICDIASFRLMGGEPLLAKNVDEYMKILRRYFPRARLRILTNGTLIPSLPQKIFDTMRENRFGFDISTYPPTAKVADKIKALLESNGINYKFSRQFERFNVFLTMHSGNDTRRSRQLCGNDPCRTVHRGKIYKCPPNAFVYKFAEKFGIENFPKPVGIDIHSPEFSSLLQMLDGDIEMCGYCGDRQRLIAWHPTNNPQIAEWLFDPDELKNL